MLLAWLLSAMFSALPTLDGYRAETPKCPATAVHCMGLAVHVGIIDGRPVATPRWLGDHIEVANGLFAPIGVAFEVISASTHTKVDVDSRADRDHLGREEFTRGVIHVYLVRRLADVDIAGDFIRGVHWRDRSNTARRWIIVSAIASKYVLAHELGHFFGLPHSRYHESIMNKKPRAIPWWKTVFVPAEQSIMSAHRDRMLKSEMLVPLSSGEVVASP